MRHTECRSQDANLETIKKSSAPRFSCIVPRFSVDEETGMIALSRKFPALLFRFSFFIGESCSAFVYMGQLPLGTLSEQHSVDG